MSYTVAILEVSEEAYTEIAEKLRKAGYMESFRADGSINMTGLAVKPKKADNPHEVQPETGTPNT